MKPDSLKLLKSSDRKARSRFLLPLAFCLLSVAFYIPPHSPHPAIAQTTDARKTEADRLMQQVQQHQTSQLRAALNSWQQALQIYRTIKNRQGEGRALGNLGLAYHYLGNDVKAIEYGQQQLVIARKIKDRQGEGAVLTNLGLAFLTTGNPTESEKMLMNGIQVWESMRQLQRLQRCESSLHL